MTMDRTLRFRSWRWQFRVREIMRFGVLGTASAAASWALFFSYHQLLHIHYLTAVLITFFTWIYPAYYIQRRWVFPVAQKLRGFLLFLAIHGLTIPAYFLGMSYLVGELRWRPSIAYASLILLISLGMFVLLKFWVFRQPART